MHKLKRGIRNFIKISLACDLIIQKLLSLENSATLDGLKYCQGKNIAIVFKIGFLLSWSTVWLKFVKLLMFGT